MTIGTTFLASLQAKGWNVLEQKSNWKCTTPAGKVYLYEALKAVQFGTWHDVESVNDVPLPALQSEPTGIDGGVESLEIKNV